MSGSSIPRVLVFAGRPRLADEVRRQLADEHLDVELVEGWHTLPARLATACTSLIVFHVQDGRLDTLETVRRARSQGSNAPVLILSESSSPGDRVLGLDAGADDWVGLPFDPAEFRARVRALLRRRRARLVNVLRHRGLAFDVDKRSAQVNGQPIGLSPREASLLHVLLTRFNAVVPRERILDEFYGLGESSGANTIDVYVSRLRRKLRSSGLAIRAMHGRGYVIGEQDDETQRTAGE